jgi:hypothetical protein
MTLSSAYTVEMMRSSNVSTLISVSSFKFVYGAKYFIILLLQAQ